MDKETVIKTDLAPLLDHVVRIDGDTVSAHPDTGVMWQETEWFRAGSPDDLTCVYSQLVERFCHLVHESDVHIPERILENLCGLGCFDL